jgi:hypothetical protein
MEEERSVAEDVDVDDDEDGPSFASRDTVMESEAGLGKDDNDPNFEE